MGGGKVTSPEELAGIIFDWISDNDFYIVDQLNDLTDVYFDGYVNLVELARRILSEVL